MFFLFFSKPYISVVGEFIISGKQENKDAIQKKLNIILNEINKQYEDNISAKFMPTIGNEFQGLVCKGSELMKMILEIKNKMYPISVRFGIGVGEITTEIQSEMAIRIQGPGYEKAREALEHLRMCGKQKQKGMADIKVEVVGEYHDKLMLVNTILSLLTTIESSWSNRQREMICDIMKHNDKQTDVARRLGVTQSTVQKSLTSAKYYTYMEAMKTLEIVFAEIGKRYETTERL